MKPQASRHRTCRRMRWSIRLKRAGEGLAISGGHPPDG
jgi:hypothetical protein